MNNCHALIPVKTLSQGKSRLRAYLPEANRKKLILQMFTHVVTVLSMCQEISQISVVTADPSIIRLKKQLGIHHYLDTSFTQNKALHNAAVQETKSNPLLIISADLPLVQKEDIQNIIQLSQSCSLVLAPSKEGTGTNILLTHTPLLVPFLFGNNSFTIYKHYATMRSLTYQVYTAMTTAFDIDTPVDIDILANIAPNFFSGKEEKM